VLHSTLHELEEKVVDPTIKRCATGKSVGGQVWKHICQLQVELQHFSLQVATVLCPNCMSRRYHQLSVDFRYSQTQSAPSHMALPRVLPLPEMPLTRSRSTFRFVWRPKIFGPAPSELHISATRAETDTGAKEGDGTFFTPRKPVVSTYVQQCPPR
jgi:hypothetical protein